MSNISRGRVTLATSFLMMIIASALIPPIQAVEWSPDMRLTWNKDIDQFPSIAKATDGKIWVAWYSYRTGNADIFYKTYDASLAHPWSPDTRLTTNSSVDKTPSIMQAADGKIWVVWSTNRMGNYEIFYKTYDGSSWSPDTRLTTNSSADELPSITQDTNGTIWVVWSSNRMGNYDEIFCKTYNGSSWSPDVRLTVNSGSDDWDPSVMEDADGYIWIVWVRNDDLYYKVIFKNMTGKVPDTRLTGGPGYDWNPSIMQAKNGTIWVVWDSDRDAIGLNSDIFYKFYDGSWASDKKLTTNVSNDLMPSITQASDNTIWIMWTSMRLNNFDIYYRTDKVPQPHDVAIFSVAPSPTTVYPGKTVYIEVVVQNHGTQHESSLTVRCYVNTTLIGNTTFELAAGQLWIETFIWDTSGFTPGTYIINATVNIVLGETDTADNTYTDGTVEVRVWGDVDGNGYVNILDVKKVKLAWSGITVEPFADLDGNGAVDVLDLKLVKLIYGGVL